MRVLQVGLEIPSDSEVNTLPISLMQRFVERLLYNSVSVKNIYGLTY